MKRISKIDLSYAAGIIDGEGSISVTRRKDRSTSVCKVAVSNTNFYLIDWLKEKFGGCTSIVIKRGKRQKDAKTWALYYNNASDFCKLVLPYLKLKCKQAEILIEMQVVHKQVRDETTTQRATRRGVLHAHGHYIVRHENKMKMIKLRAKCSVLNRRGKA